MGTPLYMRSVIDRNIIMLRTPVIYRCRKSNTHHI